MHQLFDVSHNSREISCLRFVKSILKLFGEVLQIVKVSLQHNCLLWFRMQIELHQVHRCYLITHRARCDLNVKPPIEIVIARKDRREFCKNSTNFCSVIEVKL